MFFPPKTVLLEQSNVIYCIFDDVDSFSIGSYCSRHRYNWIWKANPHSDMDLAQMLNQQLRCFGAPDLTTASGDVWRCRNVEYWRLAPADMAKAGEFTTPGWACFYPVEVRSTTSGCDEDKKGMPSVPAIRPADQMGSGFCFLSR